MVEGGMRREFVAHTEVKREMEKKEIAHAVYAQLRDGLIAQGGKWENDVNAIYGSFPHEKIIVRRDDPKKIGETIARGSALPILFDASLGGPYANSVEWSSEDGTRGLENAFAEGHSHVNGLVTIIGFSPNSEMTVRKVADAMGGRLGIDRSLVRSTEGVVHVEDMRFVIFRLPADRFPLEEMTDEERESYEMWVEDGKKTGPQFIFRGCMFDDAKRLAA